MRQHEATPDGKFCRHCSIVMTQYMSETSCVWRPDAPAAMAPQPKARTRAADDAEAISARIAELRAERTAAIAGAEPRPAPPVPESGVDIAAGYDGCCG